MIEPIMEIDLADTTWGPEQARDLVDEHGRAAAIAMMVAVHNAVHETQGIALRVTPWWCWRRKKTINRIANEQCAEITRRRDVLIDVLKSMDAED